MTEVENAPAAKLTYSAPTLKHYGTFEDLTKANNGDVTIDGVYPAHAPVAGHTS